MDEDEKYCIYDDCTSKAGEVYGMEPFDTAEEAIAAAEREWDHLTKYDRERRDSYSVMVGEYKDLYGDGDLMFDTDTLRTIKEWK